MYTTGHKRIYTDAQPMKMKYAKYKKYGPGGVSILVGEILEHKFDAHNNISNIRLVDGTIKRWSLWNWIPISEAEHKTAEAEYETAQVLQS